MNDLNIFKNMSCIYEDDVLWYYGKGVATFLGYNNTTEAIANHVDNEDKQRVRDFGKRHGKLDDQNKIYINTRGVIALAVRSESPVATELIKYLEMTDEELAEEEEQRRMDEFRGTITTDPKFIISFIQQFLTGLNIPFEYKKTVGAYTIDFYLPRHKLAVGLVASDIEKVLQCRFIRIDPDDEDFALALCIAELTRCIFCQTSLAICQ